MNGLGELQDQLASGILYLCEINDKSLPIEEVFADLRTHYITKAFAVLVS